MDRRPDVVLTVRTATSHIFFNCQKHSFFNLTHCIPLGSGYDSDPHGFTSPTSRQAVSGPSPAAGGKANTSSSA